MLKVVFHGSAILGLTLLTQIGGLAWAISLLFRRKLLVFLAAYLLLTLASVWAAPMFGRVALSCVKDGPLQVQSWMYCALNRTYIDPELAQALKDTADEMDRRLPGTVTLVLDANFPFFDGFPLLPHLSHDDGDKADLAFYYRDDSGYLKGATRSPIGYFAFEDGPTDCVPKWPTLRWDFAGLQQFWKDYEFDIERNRLLLELLASDDRIGKILVEPHRMDSMGFAHDKIRFQGCRAARHDDHIHLQL